MLIAAGDLLTAGLLFAALSFGSALLLVAARGLHGRRLYLLEPLAPLLVNGGAAWAAWHLGSGWNVLAPLILALAMYALARSILKEFTAPGRLFLTANFEMILFGLAWGVWFIATIDVSTLTRCLLIASYPLLVLTLPASLVQSFEQWDVLCRDRWRRPRAPLLGSPRAYPKVSLHVPACSEPPEIVIATLNALSRLDYPNLEVLVIDNNTADPALWRPVEAHCRRLGERFRFLHLDRWPGAKAGALNFALRETPSDTEIVGIVDSDYLAEPDFLQSLIGYFDDPKTGFVQTPHAYREWGDSAYLSMCSWEYRYFFETTMVSLNEQGAALTVGTMCLIRRQALEEAGGWAEWCATEDSELAIRIHALGYTSVYVNKVYGRGLIPETFAGYKSQRFRWTYGPVQELKRHFGLFLPRPFARPSALSPLQKLHHLNHGFDRLVVGLRSLFIPIAVALIVSMVLHHEVIRAPLALWAAASVSLAAEFVHWWLVYRITMGARLRATLGAFIASKSLYHTITISSVWALFTREIPWRRTNKFRVSASGLGALWQVPWELAFGLGGLLFAGVALAALPAQGLVLMLLIGALYQSLNYLAAPVLALLAERDIRRRSAEPVASLQAGLPGSIASYD